MNKRRRYYKQYLRRMLNRDRAIKHAVLWSMLRATAIVGVAQVANIRSTPKDQFKYGIPGKAAAIAEAVINTNAALDRIVRNH